MSPLTALRKRAGNDGIRLARWIALTRWLITTQAPLEITAAASEMAAGTRRTLRGENHRLSRGHITGRIRTLALDALDSWYADGQPGFVGAASAALRMITDKRLPAHT